MSAYTLEQLVKDLNDAFRKDEEGIDEIKSLMNSYKGTTGDWKQYANFQKEKYTRNLVDEGNGKYNLILLCWNTRQASSIHSHSGSHCVMTIVQGTVKETLYRWPKVKGTPMEEIKQTIYTEGETAYINDVTGLHLVENPSDTDQTVTLHLYSPPFDTCKCFNPATSEESTGQMLYTTKYGEPCNQESCTTSCQENRRK